MRLGRLALCELAALLLLLAAGLLRGAGVL